MGYDSEFVRLAASELTAVRPAYRDLIGFYAEIFAAQEDVRLRVRLESFRLSSDRVKINLKDGFPLIQVSEMRYDRDTTAALLKELCRIAVDRQSGLAGPAELLLKHSTEISPLFQSFIREDASRVTQTSEAMGVGPQALSFFLYHSLRPSLCRCEQELCGYLADSPPWERGYCPICGSPPALAWLEDEGQRFLHCSFCWHKWAAPRALCPFCDSRDPQGRSYIYSESEKDYRLYVCSACRKYIKTVDTRNLARKCYPPLEQIASLHMDIKAAEDGFEAGLAMSLPA